jgi:hypothetical protein
MGAFEFGGRDAQTSEVGALAQLGFAVFMPPSKVFGK